MQHLKRWTVTRYQLVPKCELHSTIVTWAWDACRTSPVVTTVSPIDNWWIKMCYNWASVRSRRLDIGRRAFMRFSSMFIKNAKNSNNIKNNKKQNSKEQQGQYSTEQDSDKDCRLFVFFFVLQEQEGKGNSKLHKSWKVKCAQWPKKLRQKWFVLFLFLLARLIN